MVVMVVVVVVVMMMVVVVVVVVVVGNVLVRVLLPILVCCICFHYDATFGNSHFTAAKQN